jgi:stage II sporulation protein P
MRKAGPSGKGTGTVIFAFFIVMLLFLSLKVGTFGGDLVYKMNNGFIENMDTQNFKELLSFELPLVDIVYNSGKVNLTGEIQDLIRMIFGIETRMPSSILSAEAAFLKNYYTNHYMPLPEYAGIGKTGQEGRENSQEEKGKREEGKGNSQEGKQNGGWEKGNSQDGEGNSQEGEENSTDENIPGKQQSTPDNQQAPVNNKVSYRQDASSIRFEEDETKHIERSHTVEEGIITLHNETRYKINEKMIEQMLEQPFRIQFDRKGPVILIYHTHTTEGYLKSIVDLDREVAVRTMDERYSVVRVGDELARLLKEKYGIDVVHNGTIHDYPDFDKSYLNSAETLSRYLKSYPSIKIAIDIHRDAVDNGEKLRVVKDVGGKNAARVMFVVGTDAGGLEHPQWKENLLLAVKMQQKLNEYCPGLAKHIYISNNRYNQHMAEGSLLIEVGGDGNLVEECLESCKYLAVVLNDVINGR